MDGIRVSSGEMSNIQDNTLRNKHSVNSETVFYAIVKEVGALKALTGYWKHSADVTMTFFDLIPSTFQLSFLYHVSQFLSYVYILFTIS